MHISMSISMSKVVAICISAVHVCTVHAAALLHSKCKTKLDKETVVKEALANVKIWEYKYYTVEQSRLQYRDTTRKLLSTNETLQNVVDQVRLI